VAYLAVLQSVHLNLVSVVEQENLTASAVLDVEGPPADLAGEQDHLLIRSSLLKEITT
jgi:hypothetical protein